MKRHKQSKPRPPGSGKVQFLNPDELDQKYEAAFSRRDMDECRQILKVALGVDPRSVEATLQKGRLLGTLCRFREARDCMQRAVDVATETAKPSVAMRAGLLAQDFYDATISEYFFRKARTGEMRKIATFALAEHLGRIRRREEARNLIAAVLEDEPGNPQAIFLMARLGGYETGETERSLFGLIAGGNPELRVRGGYELGNLRDRQGDYEGAMEAFVAAKAELREHAVPLIQYRKQVRGQFDELSKELTEESVSSWRSERFRPIRKFSGIALIAGHPRSGTTLLEQIVDSHSATISAEETENFALFAYSPLMQVNFTVPSIFQALDHLKSTGIEDARRDYLNSISRVLGSRHGSPLLVDKNPSLSHLVAAFFRIFPESKTLSMIRDPRDVILSCFMQPFAPLNPITACYTSLTECASEYADIMKVLVKSTDVFGDAVMEVRYENLVQQVEAESRRVFDFLGLPWEQEVLGFYQRAEGKIVRSPSSEAVTENVHQRAMNRWKSYEKHLGPSLEALEPYLGRWGY